jgi:hypothetical protein
MGPGVSSVNGGATAGSDLVHMCVGGSASTQLASSLVLAAVPRLNPSGGQGTRGPSAELAGRHRKKECPTTTVLVSSPGCSGARAQAVARQGRGGAAN